MPLSCKNICENNKDCVRGMPKNPERPKFYKNPYVMGFRYCTRCEVYWKKDTVRCPCCNQKLKVSPSYLKSKGEVKRI